MEDTLRLEEQGNRSRKLFYFPEYQDLASSILASELSPQDGDWVGSRCKLVRSIGDRLSYIAAFERDEDDKHRPKADRNLNYSLKEVLISRALSKLGEFIDQHGSVRFSKPIGYLTEENRRCSLFFYEEAAEHPDEDVEFLSRAFAYFVMIYNGILHKEGPKDFIPIQRNTEHILFIVDFEHCEFVPRDRINLIIDFTLYNLPRFDIQDRNSIETGFRKVFAMPVIERRARLFSELNQVSEDLATRLRPMLEERGYFGDETREIGRAFDSIMRASATLKG